MKTKKMALMLVVGVLLAFCCFFGKIDHNVKVIPPVTEGIVYEDRTESPSVMLRDGQESLGETFHIDVKVEDRNNGEGSNATVFYN